MIVNPQFFNYRLIIGSLVIAIVIFSAVSYSNYKTLEKHQMFIEQEKNLVQNELSEMILSYETVDVLNDSIAEQLQITKSKITSILDSVKWLKPNATLINKYRAQLKVLRKENANILNLLNNLKAENKALKVEVKRIEKRLTTTNGTNTAYKENNKKLVESNLKLKSTNTALIEDLEKAKQLSIANVVAQGVRRISTSNKVIETVRAKKINKFQVCFTLQKNDFSSKGTKDFYIQVLDSKMNVVADKGTLTYGKTTLIYSAKKKVNYNNEALDVCTFINKGKEKLTDGIYFVSVYYKGKKLGNTSLELK